MSGGFPQTPTRSPSPSVDRFTLTLWTSDPERAREADLAGVDRIGVDLDRLGKAERQRGLGTWISPHREEDLDALGAVLSHASLFARLNPLHAGTARELDGALARGVRVVMLPMVESACHAREFVRLVDGAATVVLLVETGQAVRELRALAATDGVDEVHLGLNDLALSLRLPNRWLTLAGDLAVEAGRVVRAEGRRFSVGAVGRPEDAALAIPANLVYAEYARAGATGSLLSRSYFRQGMSGDLSASIGRLREDLSAWSGRSDAELAAAHEEFVRLASRVDSF